MFFGVLIIAIVYVPILALSGIEGKMFHPMALTVMLALGGSLVLALTLMPALCSFLLRGNIAERDNRSHSRTQGRLLTNPSSLIATALADRGHRCGSVRSGDFHLHAPGRGLHPQAR